MDNATRTSTGVSAVVEYDYTAKEPDEINLIRGALVKNIKQQPGGWWEGTLSSNGQTGMFPDNFVRIIDTNNENTVVLRDKSATPNRRCKVIYSYSQVNDDELSLAVGDVIEFLGEVEEGWWRGRLKNKVGVFPSNFVVAIEPSPILASKRPTSNTTAAAATPNLSKLSLNAGSSAVETSANMSTMTTTSQGGVAPVSASSSSFAVSTSSAVANNSAKLNRLSLHSSKEDLLLSQNSYSHSQSQSHISNNLHDAAAAAAAAAPTLPPKPIREYCRVEFPYCPQNEDELELSVGDIITIISVELPDKGWWKGELKGKVGVFPDNFVKLLPSSDVTPINDSQQPQLQHQQQSASSSERGQSAATLATAATTASSSSSTSSSNSSASSSKVFVKKSGSSSSTQSSNRKDSFGSRDSLNDILSETGIQSGNVAAQRKSLENKNLDLTLLGGGGGAAGAGGDSSNSTRMPSRKPAIEAKSGEMRKSLENMDEKKTPPPVLTKKPLVPSKKSTTVTSVAGNILSGLKQKVKNVEHKLHSSSSSHDSADGIGASKVQIADNNEKNVVGERLRRDDSEFDKVERSSMLPDMRVGRVKAPKRRPPSAAINVIGESNNNNSVYLNGSAGAYPADSDEKATATTSAAGSSDDNSAEEPLAKPKPREWEKNRAPWMDELKASQVKKKTSPSVEPRTIMLADRSSSKLMETDSKTQINIVNSSTTTTNSSSSSTFNTHSTTTSTKVQQSSTTMLQQSMMSLDKNETIASSDMTKSMSTISAAANGTKMLLHTDADDIRMRPSSLSIRNRSISPIGRASSTAAATTTTKATSLDLKAGATPAASSTIIPSSTSLANITTNTHHHHNHHNILENNITANTAAATTKATATDSGKVLELERRVEKLESQVQLQQKIIEDLVRTLREETDRVKGLKTELDKYAQCVTQV